MMEHYLGVDDSILPSSYTKKVLLSLDKNIYGNAPLLKEECIFAIKTIIVDVIVVSPLIFFS